MKNPLIKLAFVLVAAVEMLMLTGCITDEPENVSSRPWNNGGSYSGMPSTINQGK